VTAGGSLRRELRDRMMIVEVQHLRYVMTEYRAHHGMAWAAAGWQGIGRADGVGKSRCRQWVIRTVVRPAVSGDEPRGGVSWPVAGIGRILSASSVAELTASRSGTWGSRKGLV